MKGKYEASALVDVRMTIYADDEQKAMIIATKIIRSLVSKFGAGFGESQIIELKVRRSGSGEDFAPRIKQ